jgi:CheY-like chemotaxis protein
VNSLTASILIVDDVDDNLEILGDLLTFMGTVHTAHGNSLKLQKMSGFDPGYSAPDGWLEVCTGKGR